jgi:hypothetical protein
MPISIKDGDAAPRSLGTVTDAAGEMLVRHQSEDGRLATYNVTSSTVIKAAAGRAFRVAVVVAGSAAGAVHDCSTTGAAAAANKVATIPNTVGVYDLNWPCGTGIVLVPGTGQTLSISYS